MQKSTRGRGGVSVNFYFLYPEYDTDFSKIIIIIITSSFGQALPVIIFQKDVFIQKKKRKGNPVEEKLRNLYTYLM